MICRIPDAKNYGLTGPCIMLISHEVYRDWETNLDVGGTGSVNLNGNYTGTTLRYNADGIVNLEDNKNITW